MSWPTAFVAGCVIIASAILMASFSPANSQPGSASFAITGGTGPFVWRLNTVTGAMSYCARRSDSTDPGYLADTAPNCSAFGAPVQ